MIDWAEKFAGALEYGAFLERFGSPEHQDRWSAASTQFHLNEVQKRLLSGFTREMNVLCLAGAWCGDCVNQCPILERFARACPKIHLRFLDRDADPGIANELQLCGGRRVPVVVFLSEDFAECARYGDRTLSRYRTMAAGLTGAACPTGLLPSGEAMAETADDWLREFERVQLMLRMSPRLRQKHGD